MDYRFYEKSVDGVTKNDHFRAMLLTAKERGFVPRCVVFDSWYSSLDNLKLIRDYDWLAIRAFLRLERHRFTTGISWYQAKLAIVRDAIRAHLANPQIVLIPTA